MRTLELLPGASAAEWGRIHGETFRAQIHALAAVRVYLTCKVGGFGDREQVLAVAREHLPVLERYDADLYAELIGIAEGAAIDPAELVVLNHYTDLRDLDPEAILDHDSGCSVVYARTPEGTLLGQTWDMHATAIPYVMLLRVPEAAGRPGAWLLTLTGCLGMAGLNGAGVAVAINNLHSTDARLGAIWPALVRRVLASRTAAAGRDELLASPIGSGHHYVVADPDQVYGIETSGQQRQIVFSGDAAWYVHTNHCLSESVGAHSRVPAASTTRQRYDWLAASCAARPIANAADMWRRLGSEEGYPASVCTNRSTPEDPHGTATCAGVVMNLDTRTMLAAPGLIHNVEPERIDAGAP